MIVAALHSSTLMSLELQLFCRHAAHNHAPTLRMHTRTHAGHLQQVSAYAALKGPGSSCNITTNGRLSCTLTLSVGHKRQARQCRVFILRFFVRKWDLRAMMLRCVNVGANHIFEPKFACSIQMSLDFIHTELNYDRFAWSWYTI